MNVYLAVMCTGLVIATAVAAYVTYLVCTWKPDSEYLDRLDADLGERAK